VSDDNVHRFPRREELPFEIAALSIEDPREDEPTLIVNARQTSPTPRATLRKHRLGAFVPVLGAPAMERARRAIRDHPSTFALVVASIATAATLSSVMLTSNDDAQRSPTSIPQVALPPIIHTATVTVHPSEAPSHRLPPQPRTAGTPTSKTTQAPPAIPGATHPPQPPPKPRSSTRQRSAPPARPSSPTQQPQPNADPTPPRETPRPVASDPPRPAPSSPAAPDVPEADEESPSTPAAPKPSPSCHGLIHVRINPILDACLLD
jgi:hypothetical protein